MADAESQLKNLPPPWDRIFSLGTRTFVWALLLGILYILRPFLLLIFMTFVFAYIQAHGVDGLAHRIRNRTLRVVIVGLVFLGTILATVFTLTPQIEHQATILLHDHERLIRRADAEINKFLKGNLPAVWDALVKRDSLPPPPDDDAGADVHGILLPGEGDAKGDPRPDAATEMTPPAGAGEEVRPPLPDTGTSKGAGTTTGARTGKAATQGPPAPTEEPRFVKDGVDSLLGLGAVAASGPDGNPVRNPREVLRTVLDIGTSVLGYVSSFLLSLLFSFLIVLDLPKLQRATQGLASTRIGFIYQEAAQNIATFGRVLGRALEAQLFIAVCNTILTAIGMWILGIPNILVLSAIVFLCSFIPVAGVFISSTPICLLALQDPDGGFGMMLLAIGMILLIHAIETYILNPKIYGHHMRMNPVLVLIVLTIAGKLFGVWGLILGIPIVNYFFRHAIRHPQDQPAEA